MAPFVLSFYLFVLTLMSTAEKIKCLTIQSHAGEVDSPVLLRWTLTFLYHLVNVFFKGSKNVRLFCEKCKNLLFNAPKILVTPKQNKSTFL